MKVLKKKAKAAMLAALQKMPGRREQKYLTHNLFGDVTMFGHKPAASPTAPMRHALGLPAGSVRALLAFGVLGLSWLLVWRYGTGADHKLPLEFIYLQYLAVLILAHFFAAHGGTIGQQVSSSSPLWLPTGTVRFLLIAGYLGLGAFLYLHNQIEFTEPIQGQQGLLLLLLLSSFFLGHVITGTVRLVSRGTLPFWFQDVEAWVALLALLGLGVLAMIHLFINPSLESAKRIEPGTLEAFLAAAVGFYFGARS